MWLLYVLALILGGGLLFIQLVTGGDHHVGELHPSLHGAHAQSGPGIVSTRSLVYGVAAFGLVGAPLHILGVLSPRAALGVALLGGVLATVLAGLAFRAAGDPSASGASSYDSLVGRDGRVLLECAPERPGKIRVDLGGHVVDLVATTDDPRIAAGNTVTIAAVRDDVAHVRRKEA
jgi:membrane protein implicated in regulation of membrane protease activity